MRVISSLVAKLDKQQETELQKGRKEVEELIGKK